MPSSARTGQHAQHFSLLNPDGERHVVTNSLALVTLVLGIASFLLGMFTRDTPAAAPALHVTATVTGAVAVALGMVMQMLSATRPERVLIVTGIIGGFVGACLGLAFGGFAG